MKKKIRILLGVTLLLLVGAGTYLGLTFKLPEFAGVEAIEMGDLQGRVLHATITTKIFNPNFYSLGARKVDYLISYRDTVIGRGKLQEGLSLLGGDTTHLKLPVEMELNGIFAVYESMLDAPKCKLDIHLDGEFTFLHYHHGLDLQADIAPEKFIQDVMGKSMTGDDLRLEELHWESSNLRSSQVRFVSVVKNPLDIPLILKSLDIRLYNPLGAKSLAGHWMLSTRSVLKPQYQTRLPGAMTLDHLAGIAGLAGGALTGKLKYRMEGMMVVELADLPFEIPLAGNLEFDTQTGNGRWE